MFTECVVPAHKANERSCLSSDDRSPSSSTRSETTTLLMQHRHKNKQQESFRKLDVRSNSAVISLEDGAGLFTDRVCLSCIYRPVNPYFAKHAERLRTGKNKVKLCRITGVKRSAIAHLHWKSGKSDYNNLVDSHARA